MTRPALCAAAAAILVLTGCVSSRQARHVTPSTFLGQSAVLLEKGEKNEEALLVYRKAGTDWASYDKVLLDPVALWTVRSTTLSDVALEDYQRLVDNFHLTLSANLAEDYTLVDAPAPGTLQIQTAIVNGMQANSTLKVAKLFAPYASIADFLWTFATGKPAFTGEVSLEYMIKDSLSGELLAAGVDRRVGGNQLGGATLTSWGDVRNILTYWSDLTVYRLCVDRQEPDCKRPTAGLLKR